MQVKREDKGFLRFYYFSGMGAIFYRTFPTTEMLAIEDLSLSSRLTTKNNESLLEKLLSKSDFMTSKYLGVYDDEVDLKDVLSVNKFFAKVESYLESSTRSSLYNIQSVLGHRNIGEQSSFMISMTVPEITALSIQDEIFISSQERSTRYVEFKERYLPSDITGDARASLSRGYTELSKLYNSSFDLLLIKYVEDFPSKNHRIPSEKEIKTVLSPTVRDSVRSFLPLGSNTTLVMLLSARTSENIGRKLLSSDNLYNKMAGELFSSTVTDNVPSLSTHIKPDDFNKKIYPERIKFNYSDVSQPPSLSSIDAVKVGITDASQNEKQVLNSIYYQLPHTNSKNKKSVVVDYLTGLSASRTGKFDDLNDSVLRSSFLQIDITCSLGTARDLWRHRLSNRNIEVYVNDYIIPDVIYKNGDLMRTTSDSLGELEHYLKELYKNGFYSESQLLIPLATKSDLKMSMSLAEAVFIAENRSTDEAHPEYKKIAFDLYRQLKSTYPVIMNHLKIFMGNDGQINSLSDYSRVRKPNIDSVNDSLS